MGKAKVNTRELTNFLREMAADLHETRLMDDELVYITQGEALAELIFKRALGWWEEIEEPGPTPGSIVKRRLWHRPEASAQYFIWDRLEGKSPQALPDDKGGMTTADKVSELARKRINDLVEEEEQENPYGDPPSLDLPDSE